MRTSEEIKNTLTEEQLEKLFNKLIGYLPEYIPGNDRLIEYNKLKSKIESYGCSLEFHLSDSYLSSNGVIPRFEVFDSMKNYIDSCYSMFDLYHLINILDYINIRGTKYLNLNEKSIGKKEYIA